MRSRLIILLVALFCIDSGTAFAATLYVPTAEYPTIQAGIDAASTADTVLVADGIYTGDGNKNIDFGGKAITVKSANGPDTCIIEGEGQGRGVYFHSNEGPDSVLEGFTIRNFVWRGILIWQLDPNTPNCSPTIDTCKIIGNTTTRTDPVYRRSHGAGILISTGGPATKPGASPTIKNCTIRDNFGATESGGGIFSYQSSPIIQNCDISFNESVLSGGGIGHYTGDLVITNCTIVGNTSTHVDARAGGIEIDRYWGGVGALVTNCIIRDNFPANVNIIRGTAEITYCNIEGGWVGEGNIDADPLFVDQPNGDFHLTYGSPCIDAGDPNAPSLPLTDFEGDDRILGAAPDMGVDEYKALTPDEQIDAILEFFDQHVEEGELYGTGTGWVANARVALVRILLVSAREFIERDRIGAACFVLKRAYGRCDGEPWPRDYVEGPATEELAEMIADLMDDLGCD